MANCTSCGVFNEYQPSAYLCYSCSQGFVPAKKRPKEDPVTIPNMKAVQTCSVQLGGVKCGKEASEFWQHKISKGTTFYMCPTCSVTYSASNDMYNIKPLENFSPNQEP